VKLTNSSATLPMTVCLFPYPATSVASTTFDELLMLPGSTSCQLAIASGQPKGRLSSNGKLSNTLARY